MASGGGISVEGELRATSRKSGIFIIDNVVCTTPACTNKELDYKRVSLAAAVPSLYLRPLTLLPSLSFSFSLIHSFTHTLPEPKVRSTEFLSRRESGDYGSAVRAIQFPDRERARK